MFSCDQIVEYKCGGNMEDKKLILGFSCGEFLLIFKYVAETTGVEDEKMPG